MNYGDHPEFSDEAKEEIRRVLHDQWQRDHATKNRTANQHVRDSLSERMRRFETYMEQVGRL